VAQAHQPDTNREPASRDWLSQARRGVVELCVLHLIGTNPHYGYELAIALSHWQPLAATEGTLYPLLRRLQREGTIEASWIESPEGPPRKYYRLTPAGEQLLDSMLGEWDRLTQAVSYLRNGIFDPETHEFPQELPNTREFPEGQGGLDGA
jgi:PadR family transcriptional regulator PadR